MYIYIHILYPSLSLSLSPVGPKTLRPEIHAWKSVVGKGLTGVPVMRPVALQFFQAPHIYVQAPHIYVGVKLGQRKIELKPLLRVQGLVPHTLEFGVI